MNNKTRKTRALVLFSGGLDSILAVKVLEEQGIQVSGLTFVSMFFDAENAKQSASGMGLKLIVRNFSKEHLHMIKGPKYGFGKNMNPCIDCHALMFRLAKEELEKGGFDFLATGEVLGERPMSQNKNSLYLVEKESGLIGKLLRPLSAKLLPETEAEKNGLVDREKLIAISGRSRKPQLALAKKYEISKFPTPSGGCILTEKIFSDNLRRLLEKKDNLQEKDVDLLRVGRQIWEEKIHFSVGRDEAENESLKNIFQEGDFLVEAENVPGPIILVRNYSDKEISKEYLKEKIIKLLLKYNSKARKIKNIKLNWIKG